EREALPARRDPIIVWNAHARGRAVGRKDHIAREIDLIEIWKKAEVRFEPARIGKLELAQNVIEPNLSEGLPDQHINAARAQHRPETGLEGARVGRGHDRHAIVGGQLEQMARPLDRKLKTRPALSR